MPILLTKSEAAQMLRCSVRTLDTLRAERGLPYVQMPGCRRVLFDREQIAQWLQSVNTGNSSTNTNSEAEDDGNK